jgi:hypothetical protein
MNRVRTALLGVVMVATGIYFVLYLYGWEWYRAMVVGIVFLAAELAVIGSHLGRLAHRALVADDRQDATGSSLPGQRPRDGEHVVAAVLRETPAGYHDTFRWLRSSSDGLPVFIPLLLGAGVLMSGVAWVMERVAGAVYGGRIDASLARSAARLVPPDDLLDTPTTRGLLATPGHWDHWEGGGHHSDRGSLRGEH